MARKKSTYKGTFKFRNAEVKKPVVVAIVALIAIVVLISLIFFGQRQFAGKAIALPQDALGTFNAGVVNDITLPIKTGEELIIRVGVKVPISKESVAYDFTLRFPSTLSLNQGLVSTMNEWGETFHTETSVSDNIRVVHGTLDYEKSLKPGQWEIATIVFTANQDITSVSDLTFSKFELPSMEQNSVDMINKLIRQPNDAVVVAGKICPEGVVQCANNVCSTLVSDVNNCGACGNVCPSGNNCQLGVCVELDSDGDGVPDVDDQCPGTPPGEQVAPSGCSSLPPLGTCENGQCPDSWSTQTDAEKEILCANDGACPTLEELWADADPTVINNLCPSDSCPATAAPITPAEIFAAKMKALVGGSCYQYALPGESDYCNEDGSAIVTYENGRLGINDKAYIVGRTGQALIDFFAAVFTPEAGEVSGTGGPLQTQ